MQNIHIILIDQYAKYLCLYITETSSCLEQKINV